MDRKLGGIQEQMRKANDTIRDMETRIDHARHQIVASQDMALLVQSQIRVFGVMFEEGILTLEEVEPRISNLVEEQEKLASKLKQSGEKWAVQKFP